MDIEDSNHEEKKIDHPRSPRDETKITIHGQEVSRDSIPSILPTPSNASSVAAEISPLMDNSVPTYTENMIIPRRLALSSQSRTFVINDPITESGMNGMNSVNNLSNVSTDMKILQSPDRLEGHPGASERVPSRSELSSPIDIRESKFDVKSNVRVDAKELVRSIGSIPTNTTSTTNTTGSSDIKDAKDINSNNDSKHTSTSSTTDIKSDANDTKDIKDTKDTKDTKDIKDTKYIATAGYVGNIPDYSGLTEIQKASVRADFRAKFGILQNAWRDIKIAPPGDDAPLEVWAAAYNKYLFNIKVAGSVDRNKVFLVVIFLAFEAFCTKYLGLNASGYTKCQLKSMSRYEYLLISLGEKWETPSESSWPVEVRIILLALINGVIFILVKTFCSWLGPEAADGIVDMISGFVSGGKPSVLPPGGDTKDIPGAPSGGGGFDLVSMLGSLGSLFGGGNATASKAADQPRKKITPKYKE